MATARKRKKVPVKKKRLTKEEGRAFKARWQMVAAREREELRSASLALRLKQLETLMAWGVELGWGAAGRKEAEVRDRWNRLRKAYGA